MTAQTCQPAPLTPVQLNAYASLGFCTVPDFFNAAEVRAMQDELERLVQAGLLRNVATEGDGVTHSNQKANLQICPLSPQSPLFRALGYSDKVRTAVGQLLGPEFGLRLDQIFLKPGRHGAGTKWHQDNAYFGIRDPLQGVGMWTAIHEATIANGTMHVIPHSHSEALLHARDPDSDHHIHCVIDEATAPVTPIELPAGGVLFFNYGVAHCTKGNTTDRPRAGLALHFQRSCYADHIEKKGKLASFVPLSGPGFDPDVLDEDGTPLVRLWDQLIRSV